MARTSRLYAELFAYVRIVTVHVSLSVPESVQDAVINIAPDGRSVLLFHKKERISIDLPTRVCLQDLSTSSKLSSDQGNQFTLRLNVGDDVTKGVTDLTNDSGLLLSARSENPVPWTSRSMIYQGFQISCARCDFDIQSNGKFMAWLDLPNENWADLMEFWHCHKPAEHQEPSQVPENTRNQNRKGKEYFAANSLRASQGKGFIGTSYFLLHEDDCRGAKIKIEDSSETRRRLLCSNCGNDIGNTDPSTGGWKLEKWSLHVHPRDDDDHQGIDQFLGSHGTKYDYQAAPSGTSEGQMVQKWISAQLLASAESGSTRTFVICNIPERNTVGNKELDPSGAFETTSKQLLLWVFTLDLLFSSSVRAETRQDPTRAMKIFWKPLEESSNSSPQESSYMTSNDIPPSPNHSLPPPRLGDGQRCLQPEQGQGQGQGQEQEREHQQEHQQATSVSHLAHMNSHHHHRHQKRTKKALAPAPSGPHEEIPLPSIIFRDLCRALERSADYMPESSREFQGWRVGLLERFRESECGQ